MANAEFFAEQGIQIAPGKRFRAASGNTAQRPPSPLPGDFRYNSDLFGFEGYSSNGGWGSVSGTPIPANAVFANSILVGNSTANVFITPILIALGSTIQVNSTAVQVSNNTVQATVTAGSVQVGANVSLNSTGIGIGNSTVSISSNSTQIRVGSTTTLVDGTLTLGGTTLNSSSYTGTALNALNATNLGGIAAAQYAFANQVSGAITPGGSNTFVQFNNSGSFAGFSGLTFNFQSNTLSVGGATINASSYSGTANNALNLGGTALSAVWTKAGLTSVSQLTNDSHYITGLSSSTSYTVFTMLATSYLYSDGNVYAVGNVFAAYSDIRLKYDIRPIEGALDRVCSLQGMTYLQNDLGVELTGRRDDRRQSGLSAQDVLKVLPEAVALTAWDRDEDGNSKSGENYLTLQYERIVPLLVEAIKELRQELQELKLSTARY